MNPWLLPLVPALAAAVGLAGRAAAALPPRRGGIVGTGGALLLAIVAVAGRPGSPRTSSTSAALVDRRRSRCRRSPCSTAWRR